MNSNQEKLDPMLKTLSDQETVRRNKLKELQDLKKNPYDVEKVENRTNIFDIVKKYNNWKKEDLENLDLTFTCCGRVVLQRQPFFVISEEHVHLQVYLNIKNSDESLVEYFKKFLDIGDFVQVIGKLFLTQKNELTLRIQDLKIISKCLRPLPEKHSGIKDKELLVRERVAALIANDDMFHVFKVRSEIFKSLREFLNNKEYMEVETTMLHAIAGGASAKPFITHYNCLHQDLFLRIAPELPLKQLITAGYKKIYEIGKSFRNEGSDSTHNPEFTSIEIYTAYDGMEETMNLCEGIFHHIAHAINKTHIKWHEKTIDIAKKFKRLFIPDALYEKIKVNFFNTKVSLEEAIKIAKNFGCELQEHEKKVGHIINKLFEILIEPELNEPTFVYGYHKDVSPLSKNYPNNPEFTLRFELFICGKEFANGFAELNDPIEQLKRFQEQDKERQAGNDEVHGIDYNYVKNIEFALPPTGGLGIGLDRLVMLFTETHSIRDVLFFPHTKN